jgi:hypothetical protein
LCNNAYSTNGQFLSHWRTCHGSCIGNRPMNGRSFWRLPYWWGISVTALSRFVDLPCHYNAPVKKTRPKNGVCALACRIVLMSHGGEKGSVVELRK